jgi:hydrogenase-4 component F
MAIAVILFSALLSAAFLFIFRSVKLNCAVPKIYAFVHLVASAWLCLNPESFTVFFAADRTNCFFLLLMSVIFAGVSVYNADFMGKQKITGLKGAYCTAALLGFVAAMSGALLSSNLGMMWVFVEATTLASAYLIYFKGGKAALEAAWKYIFICSIGIAFAFMGIIFLSMSFGAQGGSLSFKWMEASAAGFSPFWLKLAFVFLAVGFGTKTGLAPVHAWLPDAHSEAPSPVSALLSASLLNTAMLALIKIYAVMAAAGMERFASFYMMLMGFLSVFVAAVYLVRVGNYKRMLAYSSIENMGLIAIALSLGKEAFPALIIQAAGHSLSKASMFLTSGNVLGKYGSREISAVSGMLRADNKTAWLWIGSFVMVSGIPPSPVFISEFLIIKRMLFSGMWGQAVILLILLTIVIYGMASAVFKMCFGEQPDGVITGSQGYARYAPQAVFILILTAMTFYLTAAMV